MAWRYLVPGLAVAARLAAAQCQPNSGTVTISTQAQATALAGCTTFKGDILIAPNTKEDISLDGIGHLEGSLYVNKANRQMTSLSAEDLNTIDDTFGILDSTGIANLDFGSLTAVGTIDWNGIPNLASLDFAAVVTKASVLSVQNTGLQSLDGIDLDKFNVLYLANNFYLNSVSMKVTNVSDILIQANGRDVKVDFPDLKSGHRMIFKNITEISLPKLAFATSSVGFYSNFFDSLELPKLTAVDGSLAFVSNGMLNDLSLPVLKATNGGIQIANNSKLIDVDGFPKLTTVLGAIDMYGSFKDVKFPSLNLVKGAFNLQSSNKIPASICNHFGNMVGQTNTIEGHFECKGSLSNPKGLNGQTTGSGGSSSGATSLLIPYATGFIGVVAAIFGML